MIFSTLIKIIWNLIAYKTLHTLIWHPSKDKLAIVSDRYGVVNIYTFSDCWVGSKILAYMTTLLMKPLFWLGLIMLPAFSLSWDEASVIFHLSRKDILTLYCLYGVIFDPCWSDLRVNLETIWMDLLHHIVILGLAVERLDLVILIGLSLYIGMVVTKLIFDYNINPGPLSFNVLVTMIATFLGIIQHLIQFITYDIGIVTLGLQWLTHPLGLGLILFMYQKYLSCRTVPLVDWGKILVRI